MTTRLDRLFVLLDTGSTPVVRKTAAEQLGQVQKLHPHELNNLLTKIHFYLGSGTWESRIAAGQAVEAICKNVPQWRPQPKPENTDSRLSPLAMQGRLQLSEFDILQVLKTGAALCGSEGTEYDLVQETGMINSERLAEQKQNLKKRLGLDGVGGVGTESSNLFAEEDLILNREDSNNMPKPCLVKELLTQTSGVLSAREKNRAKRKAKLLARQQSMDTDTEVASGEPKIRKTASVLVEQPDQDKVLLDSVPENMLNMDDLDEWPFESFCDQLTSDLFHLSWEKRHGAATALREVVKLHWEGAGKTPDMSGDQMKAANRLWLEDTSVRLVCVLALDRFGDFVSDEVVAPVRETCAQALGAVLHVMDSSGVCAVVKVLLQLLGQGQWEVRHGSLLAFKYLFAVRQDLSMMLLPDVLPSIIPGLTDSDDDVRAVAAASLLPVVDTLVRTLPLMVDKIVDCVWKILTDLDDLTASTGSVMTLLSTLLANPNLPANCVPVDNLPDLIPRLYPFLSHNIVSVREASLDAFSTLLNKYNVQDANDWLMDILSDALRHIFQRSLLEEKSALRQKGFEVWCGLLNNITPIHIVAATSHWTGDWLSLLMQPSRVPFDNRFLVQAKYSVKEMTPSRSRHLALHGPREHKDTKHYIGGGQLVSESTLKRDQAVIQARIMAAKLLGYLFSKVVVEDLRIPKNVELPGDALGKLLVYHLSSKSALHRMCVGVVIVQWTHFSDPCPCPEFLKLRLHQCLTEPVYYDEIAMAFTRTQTQSQDFILSLKQKGIDMDGFIAPGSILTLEQATELSTTIFDRVKVKLKGKVLESFEDRRRSLQLTVEQTSQEQQVLHNRVQSLLASALVLLHSLPDKLNPVIRPIMETAKKEENAQLQICCGQSLSRLLDNCRGRDPCPNAKVIKNLCTLLCSDPLFTPKVTLGPEVERSQGEVSGGKAVVTDTHQGILTLWSQNQSCDAGTTGRGRKPNWVKRTLPKSIDLNIDDVIEEMDEGRRLTLTGRRGATLYLTQIAQDFGERLPTDMAPLWSSMWQSVMTKQEPNDDYAQELVNSLQVLEVTGSAVHRSQHSQLLSLLPSLLRHLHDPYTAVRHVAARCFAMLTKLDTMAVMEFVLDSVVPLLGATDGDAKRQGAIEALANIINQLGVDLMAYIVLVIVPVLGRMSDQNDSVRLMATHCFATLIKLLPLESAIPDPPSMKQSLVERKQQERKFLEQLLDGSKVETYKVPIPVKAELRKYQQDGVNWMWFLNKYKLHGILCDDMGLGKTLQSLCILAGDHFNRNQVYQRDGAADSCPLPSIVVCPPTLTGHWVYEIEKFISNENLNPLHYTGPPSERVRLQKRVKKHNVVIVSYDVVRNDIDFFSSLKWNYCVLDEGHIIKNSKTKISRSVKQLSCNHRLILSGTPIQNNVLELWSLFDFLMPGFLGTEKQFQARYGRPILLSRDAKSSSKEQEAGALAMEALHRQVLPFLLRRMKEDVLKDLPPKIIQDYYCDLSPLQVQLYEDFAKSRTKQSMEEEVHDIDTGKRKVNVKATTHIFQALQYLRKLCNHPGLVLNPQHPEYNRVKEQLKQQGSKLRELQHAPKLTALKQLLLDCGIGVSDSGADNTPVVNQHRVLLFCQLKSMLDIVEHDLLKTEMSGVTYLRLDGSVPPGNRISIVNRFNNDPSIDMLLLTTHVGGLGLNLTGADTVIFVEHDWNPMKDLQAMDRAHRIGQKKVVNVYRLITRGTLEEKIMGLQKFKLNIANTVISQDNSSLSSMATDQVLDLFSLDEREKSQSAVGKDSQSDDSVQKTGAKSVLENLEELWDEKQYEDEYDLSSFISSLKK